MKFIKLKSVLPDLASTLSPTFWNEADAIEWAFKAMRKIDSFEQYEVAMSFIPVASHKCNLPSDLKKMVLASYKVDTNTSFDLEAIQNELQIDNENWYAGFTQAGLYISDYSPLRLESSPFSNQVLCDECDNIATHAEHSYRINPNMTLTLSFEAGSVCLAYLRFAVDCDDDYLIPDEEEYIDAVRSYILSRYWEARWNANDEPARDKFEYYSLRWQTLCRKVKGKLKRWNIIDVLENIRQQGHRLIPNERNYYTAFSSKREEQTDF